MTYVPIESQVMVILATVPALALGNLTSGDYSVLDKGFSEAVVLEPGSFTDEVDEWTLTDPSPMRHFTWDILANVFERYQTTQPSTTGALSVLRDAIVQALVKAPNLNNSTLRVQLLAIAADGDPTEVRGTDGTGPYFMLQVLRLKVRELDSNTAGNV